MINRRATLGVYFVPTDAPGRHEATWCMRSNGDLVKQQLMLTIWDTKQTEVKEYSHENVFYRCEFQDDISIADRFEEILEEFNGTHSRRTNGYQDDASFGVLERDYLIGYLKKLPEFSEVAQTTS